MMRISNCDTASYARVYQARKGYQARRSRSAEHDVRAKHELSLVPNRYGEISIKPGNESCKAGELSKLAAVFSARR